MLNHANPNPKTITLKTIVGIAAIHMAAVYQYLLFVRHSPACVNPVSNPNPNINPNINPNPKTQPPEKV